MWFLELLLNVNLEAPKQKSPSLYKEPTEPNPPTSLDLASRHRASLPCFCSQLVVRQLYIQRRLCGDGRLFTEELHAELLTTTVRLWALFKGEVFLLKLHALEGFLEHSYRREDLASPSAIPSKKRGFFEVRAHRGLFSQRIFTENAKTSKTKLSRDLRPRPTFNEFPCASS